jgi:hypothetical protein
LISYLLNNSQSISLKYLCYLISFIVDRIPGSIYKIDFTRSFASSGISLGNTKSPFNTLSMICWGDSTCFLPEFKYSSLLYWGLHYGLESVYLLKGECPPSNSHIKIPYDHTSAALPSYPAVTR